MDIQTLKWHDFLAQFDWQQGEHVSILGPTGCGKTTIIREILHYRDYVIVFATKRRDTTFNPLFGQGFIRAKKWPAPGASKIVLWPRMEKPEDFFLQRQIFLDALIDTYRQGGWCLVWDEIRYLSDFVGLAKILELHWQQGRAVGISVLASTQRPFKVPLVMYDQATHLFLFHDSDSRNLKRLDEISGQVDKNKIKELVASLKFHEVLYLNLRKNLVIITKVEKLKEG